MHKTLPLQKSKSALVRSKSWSSEVTEMMAVVKWKSLAEENFKEWEAKRQTAHPKHTLHNTADHTPTPLTPIALQQLHSI